MNYMRLSWLTRYSGSPINSSGSGVCIAVEAIEGFRGKLPNDVMLVVINQRMSKR